MKALQMLDGGQTDKRLKEKEESYAVSRSNNPVYRTLPFRSVTCTFN